MTYREAFISMILLFTVALLGGMWLFDQRYYPESFIESK